jgi:hypothetical protein
MSTTTPAPSWPRIVGKQAFGIGAGQCELIGVTDAGGLDLDQHFALARPLELDGGYFQRLSSSDGGMNIHGNSSVQILICSSSICDTAQVTPRDQFLPHSRRSGNRGAK